MDNTEVVSRISELVEEEHRLNRTHVGTGLSEEERARVRSLEVQLDQCWDLLRQRRARREFGEDPDGAQMQSPWVVEEYEQ